MKKVPSRKAKRQSVTLHRTISRGRARGEESPYTHAPIRIDAGSLRVSLPQDLFTEPHGFEKRFLGTEQRKGIQIVVI